jgi:hypothetical protein
LVAFSWTDRLIGAAKSCDANTILAHAFHADPRALVFTPHASRPILDTSSFTIDAYPLRAVANYARSRVSFAHNASAASGACAFAVNPHPSIAFTNYASATCGILAIYAKSAGRALAQSSNTMPSSALTQYTSGPAHAMDAWASGVCIIGAFSTDSSDLRVLCIAY